MNAPIVDEGRQPEDVVPVVTSFVLTLLVAVLLELPYLNGPWYWQWRWLDPGLLRTLLLFLPGGALLALGLRGLPAEGRPARPGFAIACFTCAALTMQVLGILVHPKGFMMVHDIVVSPVVTSYFNDAQRIERVAEWLPRFQTLDLGLHSGTHPPGAILYYRAWTLIAGPGAAPYAGALTLGIVASLGVPAVYRFAGLWTSSIEVRLLAAALYAAMPGLTSFFPMFDQTYALVTMAVAGTWKRGLDGEIYWTMLSGVVLGVGSFFAYNLLTLGAFMGFAGAATVARTGIRRVLLAAALAVAGFAAFHLVLAACTGFRAPASFLRALDTQAGHTLHMDRPWLACVVFDLYDFVLGSGFVVMALVAMGLRRDPPWRPRTPAGLLTALGLATVLAVDLTGVLRAETARVWLFLQPFLIVPAAMALESLPAAGRRQLLFLHWLTLVVLRCKMGFVLA